MCLASAKHGWCAIKLILTLEYGCGPIRPELLEYSGFTAFLARAFSERDARESCDLGDPFGIESFVGRMERGPACHACFGVF